MNTEVIIKLGYAAAGFDKEAKLWDRLMGLFSRGAKAVPNVVAPAASAASPGISHMAAPALAGAWGNVSNMPMHAAAPAAAAASSAIPSVVPAAAKSRWLGKTLGATSLVGAAALPTAFPRWYEESSITPGWQLSNPVSWFNPTSQNKAFQNAQQSHNRLESELNQKIDAAYNANDTEQAKSLSDQMRLGTYSGGWGPQLKGFNPFATRSLSHYADAARGAQSSYKGQLASLEDHMARLQQRMQQRGAHIDPSVLRSLQRQRLLLRERIQTQIPSYGGEVEQRMQSPDSGMASGFGHNNVLRPPATYSEMFAPSSYSNAGMTPDQNDAAMMQDPYFPRRRVTQ